LARSCPRVASSRLNATTSNGASDGGAFKR
jgi:hypothetical protein